MIDVYVENPAWVEDEKTPEDAFYEASFSAEDEDVKNGVVHVYESDIKNIIKSFKKDVARYLKEEKLLETSQYKNWTEDEPVPIDEVKEFIENIEKYRFYMFDENYIVTFRAVTLKPVIEERLLKKVA